jgi:prepilin-type N-terminal cleavage/methylation domain-containing protein
MIHACAIPRAGRRGFSLIELMITLGIATLFVTGVIIFTTITFRQGIFAIGNYTDLNAKSRRTLDIMSRDIRNATQVTAFTPSSITLTNTDGTRFSYKWDGSNNFTRVYNGVSTVLMSNCDYACFNIYNRVPTNNFDFIRTSNAVTETKLIDVSWRCSRKYMGKKLNTESVQTARIVIRN